MSTQVTSPSRADDLLVTRAERVTASAREGLVTCVLIKPNQAGTVTETRMTLEAARRSGLAAIVSARSGESEDVTISHLAVGWNVGQIKVGSITRGERTAKWNELLRIEEVLGAQAPFAGASALRPLGRIEKSLAKSLVENAAEDEPSARDRE